MKRLNHYLQNSKPFRNRLRGCRKIATQNDPQIDTLCDLLPTGSRLWRHFRSKCKNYRRLHCGKFYLLALYNMSQYDLFPYDSFWDIKKSFRDGEQICYENFPMIGKFALDALQILLFAFVTGFDIKNWSKATDIMTWIQYAGAG